MSGPLEAPGRVRAASASGGAGHRGPQRGVRETGGDRATCEVSQQENCFGRAEVGDRVEIRKDPLGLLDLRLPDGPDQVNTTGITLAAATGLTLLTAAATFYAGQRRRQAV
ncbi:hypothetical protein ACFRH6_15190 [Streptomyces sp. NPDC056749]|uniref:hypothetical protein n=1 Tax=Streptomyces sp. NPDC056749 TaxID=3345936 RepID=UPI0036B4821F